MSVIVTQDEINIKNINNINPGIKGKEILEANQIEAARKLIGAGNQNLLVNGGFDIWQRGESHQDDGFCADSWEMEVADAANTNGAIDWKFFTIGSDNYLAIANDYNDSTRNLNSVIYKWNTSTLQFDSYQSIATSGAYSWEFFTISGDHYLAVANNYNGTTRNINSVIYKWNTGTLQFDIFQSIATNGAIDWEFFTISGDHYLAIANYYNDSTQNLNSVIYKWNTGTLQFDSFQSIATSGAFDWEFFTIGTDHYLAIANYYNGTTRNVNSVIYKWNTGTLQFDVFQSIATNGAIGWKFFTISGDHYLAVANYYNGSTYNNNSVIYKWNTGTLQFDSYQSIATNGGRDWESFIIGSDHYLAVTNNYNGTTRNVNSVIYKWNTGTLQFDSFQSIATSGAFDWEFFTIGTDHYLAVANNYNDSTRNIQSPIYKWDDTEELFEEYTFIQTTYDISIATNGAIDWEFFTIGSDHYLAVANYYNGSTYNNNSVIYKWNTGTLQFDSYQSIATNGGRDWESFIIGSDHYLAVANTNNDSTFNNNSVIYKWNTSTLQFDSYQSIATSGAINCKFFTISDNHYLAVANTNNDSTFNINSVIYKWNTGTLQFDSYQSIATSGAIDWDFFTIGSDSYLAVTNNHNGTTRNINSVIYKWNTGTLQFDSYQSIATNGGRDWESFIIGSDHYLAVTNNYNDSTYNINSVIYKWNTGTLQFDIFQSIATSGAMDWEFFTISGDHYLAIANYYNGTTLNLNSVIYKWNTGTLQFDSFQSIATNGAFDWHFFTIETDHYLAIANFHNGSTHNADSKIYKWNTNTLQFDANFTGTIGYADKTINKGLRLFDVRSNETSISISQKIEEIEKITDNSLTLSFTASSTKSTEVITSIVINGIIYSQTDSVSSEEKQIKFTAGISDTITSLSILISMKNDGTNELFLSEAKLEEGSIASGFERNSIAKELIICRRYARLSDVNVRAAEFTYEMYAAPTVTALGIGFLYEANL